MKALSSRGGCEVWTTRSTQRLRCTMFIPDVKDKVEDATAVMQRQVRNSQAMQRIVRMPRFSTSRSRRFPDRVRWRDEAEKKKCRVGSEEHRLVAKKKAHSRGTQAVLNSADEGKDNRADRRRLRRGHEVQRVTTSCRQE